ncbi:MAG: FAD-dependent monooxygenase [Gammaproteobacteria bacterium]
MWRLTYSESAELDEAGAAGRIPEHYASILPDPKAPWEIVASSPYRVHERCAPRFRVGRVLLAGDAAHACNPCGGMGLTGGIIDAMAAVDVLEAVIGGKAPESVLDFYSTERRRVFLEVSSPVASGYKQRMCEPDAQKRRAQYEEFRALAEAPETGLDGNVAGEAGRRGPDACVAGRFDRSPETRPSRIARSSAPINALIPRSRPAAGVRTPPCTGARSGKARKRPVEMALLGKAAGSRYLRERDARIEQQSFRLGHPGLQEPPMGGSPVVCRKARAK